MLVLIIGIACLFFNTWTLLEARSPVAAALSVILMAISVGVIWMGIDQLRV